MSRSASYRISVGCGLGGDMENQLNAGRLVRGGIGKNTNATTTCGNNSTVFPKVRKGTKEHAVLSALITGRSYNRFEAERELHDHCLHSTVSTLQGKGISIHRENEKVPCMGGEKLIDVKRYRLLPHEIEKAKRLLGVAA